MVENSFFSLKPSIYVLYLKRKIDFPFPSLYLFISYLSKKMVSALFDEKRNFCIVLRENFKNSK